MSCVPVIQTENSISDFVVPGKKVDQEYSEEVRNEIYDPYPSSAVWDA
jgi:hypothetical protein